MKALIMGSKVVDTADNEYEIAPPLQWVDAPADCEMGWEYSNGAFSNPFSLTESEETERELQFLRSERKKKLNRSDWTQMPDVDLSSTEKTEWANYRQALRDITESFQSVNDEGFAWPTEPSA